MTFIVIFARAALEQVQNNVCNPCQKRKQAPGLGLHHIISVCVFARPHVSSFELVTTFHTILWEYYKKYRQNTLVKLIYRLKILIHVSAGRNYLGNIKMWRDILYHAPTPWMYLHVVWACCDTSMVNQQLQNVVTLHMCMFEWDSTTDMFNTRTIHNLN